MKIKLLLIVILSVFIASCAPLQVISYDQPFVKVYENLPGDKNQLFVKANGWMVRSFNNSKIVIQYSDKEEGIIIGKYLMSGEIRTSTGAYSKSVDTQVFALIDIRVMDNKARISIEPLDSWAYDPSGMSIYNFSKEACLAEMERLSKDFNISLNAKIVEF